VCFRVRVRRECVHVCRASISDEPMDKVEK
jgi:hypothetical protein